MIVLSLTWLKLGRNGFQATLLLLLLFTHNLFAGLFIFHYALLDQIIEVQDKFWVENSDVAAHGAGISNRDGIWNP